jgi:hypothetical protein
MNDDETRAALDRAYEAMALSLSHSGRPTTATEVAARYREARIKEWLSELLPALSDLEYAQSMIDRDYDASAQLTAATLTLVRLARSIP